MWFTLSTGGDSVAERPLCVLVHYLLCLNLLCLVAAQILLTLVFGPRTFVAPVWPVASGILFLAHIAFAFLFAWIDGEAIRGEPGAEVEIGDGASESGGGSDGGSDG